MNLIRNNHRTTLLMGATIFASATICTFTPQEALAADAKAIRATPIKKAPIYKAPVQQAPVFSWAGNYLGGHIGLLLGRTSVDDHGIPLEHGTPTNGIIGGILAGANWQNDWKVFGVEGDFGLTNAHATDAVNSYDIRWAGHARGRAGLARDQFLLFGAGGGAFAGFQFGEGQAPAAPPMRTTLLGWTLGGGVDYVVDARSFARLEYLYDNFGHKNLTGSTGGQYRVGLTAQVIRGAWIWKY
jgi:outer membrane immunogenic protein